MNRRLAVFVSLALLLLPAAVRADDDKATNLSYDDPAIHYAAPDGWDRLDVPDSEDAPAALFSKQFSRYDTRVIMLKFEKSYSSLDGFETAHESEQRSANKDVFVDKKQRFTMPNGMPAWMLRYSYGDAGQTVRTMEYIIFDGKRAITLSYTGRAGTFSDDDAVTALKTLTVVLYPQGR